MMRMGMRRRERCLGGGRSWCCREADFVFDSYDGDGNLQILQGVRLRVLV